MNTKEAEFCKGAAALLRQVGGERDELLEKNASLTQKVARYERRTHAEKVAAQMHQKGINTDIEFPTLVTDLEKAAEEGRLPVIEEAVSMTCEDMGLKTASIRETPTGAGEDPLTSFLLGSVG